MPAWQQAGMAIWNAVKPELKEIAHKAIGALVDKYFGHVAPQLAPGPAPALRFFPAISPVLRLELVRRWEKPAVPHRALLGVGAAGNVGVAYTGRNGLATVETKDGFLAWSRQLAVPRDTKHSPLVWAEFQPMVRDDRAVIVNRDPALSSGEWESYSGIQGAVLGFRPCPKGSPISCKGTSYLAHLSSGTWEQVEWKKELFGINLRQLEGKATETVGIATREQPNSSGWTFRAVEASQLRAGNVAALGAAALLTWKPSPDLSLEDPLIVPGSSSVMIVGEAFDRASQSSSGRIFLAEPGQELHEILRAAPVDGNIQVGAVVHHGIFYLAAQTIDGNSGLYFWENGGLSLATKVQGKTPSLVSAEGYLWVATDQGLWRAQP